MQPTWLYIALAIMLIANGIVCIIAMIHLFAVIFGFRKLKDRQ